MSYELETTDFISFDRFAAVVGLIEDTDRLNEINAPGGFDERAGYENAQLDALEEFCLENPQFHIATVTTASDDAEAGEYERLFPNWQRFSDAKRAAVRELVPVTTLRGVNRVQKISRLNYFLADGDKNQMIAVTETTGDRHGYTKRFWICDCDRPVFSHSYQTRVCSRCRAAAPAED